MSKLMNLQAEMILRHILRYSAMVHFTKSLRPPSEKNLEKLERIETTHFIVFALNLLLDKQ
jgi:hypothetical protein